jgi:hypothetical protein
MAVAEVVVADEQVARAHRAREAGVVLLHRRLAQLVDVGRLDVLDADDLVDVEVELVELESDAAAQVLQRHGRPLQRFR